MPDYDRARDYIVKLLAMKTINSEARYYAECALSHMVTSNGTQSPAAPDRPLSSSQDDRWHTNK